MATKDARLKAQKKYDDKHKEYYKNIETKYMGIVNGGQYGKKKIKKENPYGYVDTNASQYDFLWQIFL